MYYLDKEIGAFINESEIELVDGTIPEKYVLIAQPPERDFDKYLYDDTTDTWVERNIEVPVVDVISRRQGLLLLESMGALQVVEDTIATLPKMYQIEWENASVFDKTHPLINQMATSLGITDLNLFFYKASLK